MKTKKQILGKPADGMVWRLHVPNLLQEILNNPGTAIMQKPMMLMKNFLGQTARRAIELDDPKLNWLMCRMALYQQADPETPDYDPATVEAARLRAESAFDPITESIRRSVSYALAVSEMQGPKGDSGSEETLSLREFRLANEFIMWCRDQRLCFKPDDMDQFWIRWQRDKWGTQETEEYVNVG